MWVRWFNIWKQWRNDTGRGKLKHREKNIYSIGGGILNECGAIVEWFWQRKTEELGENNFWVWVVVGWMSREQWCYITDRRNLKPWEKKKLKSMGGRLLNECEAIVESYWQGKTEELVDKNNTAWVGDGWISVEQWRSDTQRGKLKNLEKKILECEW